MPAYSIGKQTKKASFINNNDIPGVGAYDCTAVNISKVTRGPTFVIGRSTRIKTDKSHGPGPTSYNIINQSMFMEKNKGCQITGKIRQRIRSQGPGPASYIIPKLFTPKNISFGMRTQIMNKSQNYPGPGNYDIDKIKHSHAISFQQSKRPSVQGSPRYLKAGPGDYNISQMNQTKNKFSFPRKNKFFQEQHEQKQKNKIPGPGTYSNVSINHIKKQILAVRFGKTKRDFPYGDLNIPGPGAYSPTSSTRKKSPVATIGNSPKASFQQVNQNPGPSTYKIIQLDNVKRKQPSVKFGKTSRDESNPQKFIKAGPGSYNIDYHDRGHAYSISGRNSKQKISQFPGPMSYNPKYDVQFRRSQMALMTKDKKFHQSSQKNPGPGSYNQEDFTVKSKTFYFPKQTRKQNISNNPGPGTYELKPFIGSQVSIQNKK